MKSKLALILIAAVSLPLFTSFAGDIPYHPYRKVGDRYVSLQPLYNFLAGRVRPNPMPDWLISSSSSKTYKVSQVLPEGLLVELKTFSYSPGTGSVERYYTIFIKNYPGQANLTDGQRIEFLALREGNYKFTDTSGAVRTVEAYDYGIPYNPWEKARQLTNTIASH